MREMGPKERMMREMRETNATTRAKPEALRKAVDAIPAKKAKKKASRQMARNRK